MKDILCEYFFFIDKKGNFGRCRARIYDQYLKSLHSEPLSTDILARKKVQKPSMSKYLPVFKDHFKRAKAALLSVEDLLKFKAIPVWVFDKKGIDTKAVMFFGRLYDLVVFEKTSLIVCVDFFF